MGKVISAVIGMIVGAFCGAGFVADKMTKQVEQNKQLAEKHLILLEMMSRWVRDKQDGKNFADYLNKKGYRRIAVYGMSYAGECLVNELKETNVKVAFGIDQRAETMNSDVDVKTMNEKWEEVDAIVVTAITFFDEIKENLEKKVTCDIISLEELIYEA